MGADFIKRAAKTFVKRWDEGRRMLSTADLFTREPVCGAHSTAFDLERNADVFIGERLTVEKDGETLVARHGLSEIARALHPPADLLEAVERSCGIAMGTIETIHVAANIAEISLC
ncbi:hypothetical protein [Terriglobus roseus]|uniref:Uncharacterized protein n=1 Tax=Terriglobus roseus TaxID=392734 RepID=A0A1G7JGB3_9BACT|nr:hypothetical protein [Terriglobus roseus]SDF23895.1 hypothetical protein SAMN05444167_1810 [Terriglobus roseus]